MNSRCFCSFPAVILVNQNGAPTWRLDTKLYKGAWNAFGKELINYGPQRSETWTNCLYISLLQHFIFLASSAGRFPIQFSVAWQWKRSIVQGTSRRRIAHFTVTGGNKAGVNLVLIGPFLLYYVNHVFLMLTCSFQAKFTLEKEGGLYQNKGNLSLTFTQRLGHSAHNCKMAHLVSLTGEMTQHKWFDLDLSRFVSE